MLKSVFVEERDLDSTWFSLLSELYKHGRENEITYGSYAGAKRLEFDYVAGTIKYPTTRPLAPTVPEGVPVPTTDKDIEKYFLNYIMDGENLSDNEHYRYATWINGGWYRLPKCTYSEIVYDVKNDLPPHAGSEVPLNIYVPSQIEWIINHYKERGFGNNHCYIQVGYPESSFSYDMPWKDESERQTSPCLRGIDTHIKKDGDKWKLCFAVTFRSWDLYGGFPENLGGITLLMEYIADMLEIEVGTLSFNCLKLHAYDFQLDALKARLNI